MPKKVSEKEKKELVSAFINGQTVEDLSNEFNISKATISRHLKNLISDPKYKDIARKNKNSKKNYKLEKESPAISKKDKDEKKVYFEFSDYSTSYIFYESPN